MNNRLEFEKGIRIEPVVSTSIDTKGELEVLNTGGYLNYHNGTSASHVVTANHTETLTNKTITSPVITTPTGITKADVGLGNVDNTSDATKNAAAVSLTNHTIDGDTNTVQDLALASLKTVIGDANKILKRDASGIVVSSTATLDASDNLKIPGTLYIGSGTIDTSAIFQTDSTTKGSLFSRVTTAQRNAIVSPANGLWVFNTDTRIFEYYDSVSTSWAAVGAGAGGVVLTAQQAIGTGNGILTSFGPLDNVPNSEEAVLVTIDGLVEPEANWSLSGSNIVFSTAPAAAQTIYAYYMYGAGPGGGGEANTASNMGSAGDGQGFVTTKVGVDLPFKRLKAGTNVTLTSETNDIKIDVATPALITLPNITRLTSGSGTFSTTGSPRYLKIRMVGAGGGGSGSSSNAFNAGDGNNGTNSTFGTSLLTAGLGAGGAHPISSGANGGTGGSNTINSPAISVINVIGGTGGSNLYRTGGNVNGSGGAGGNSALGGGGNGAIGNGGNGQTNTGSGGAGGGQTGASGDFSTGAGGGAGGYIEAIINTPSATYSYVVGVSGGGGSAGSAGSSGGIGGSGFIVIEEYY